jgi:hypothetical protein
MHEQSRFPTHLVLFGAAVLVALGVAGRLLPHWPNFTPVVALAVFAAYAFRTSLLAWVVPVAVMAISNAIIGTYEWGVMASVYGALLLAVAIGRVSFQGGASGFTVGAASLASALAFFVITNFAVWAFGAHGTAYPMTAAGLIACYTAALPYFKFLLAGTAFWAIVLFGGHALAGRLLSRYRTAESAS